MGTGGPSLQTITNHSDSDSTLNRRLYFAAQARGESTWQNVRAARFTRQTGRKPSEYGWTFDRPGVAQKPYFNIGHATLKNLPRVRSPMLAFNHVIMCHCKIYRPIL